MYPWLDRAGRLSPLKLVVFVGLFVPAIWLAYLTATDALGPKPVTTALHQTGSWAIRFLLLSLAVTPLRRIADWPKLILVRRMLGLAVLAYALLHFSLYSLDEQFDLRVIASEIVLRVYLTIGFAALLGLIALGVTSTDGAIKRLGAERWNRLHQLVYLIAILGILHFFMQSKRDVTEAALMGGFFILLMSYRVAIRLKWPLNTASLAALGLVSAVLTALVEAGWYSIATGVPGRLVLMANLDPTMTWRPAWVVACVGLAVALVPLFRKSRSRAPAARRERERTA